MATKRRINKEETITCRVPETIREKISSMAERERRTISATALILLEEALQARESKVAA